MSLSVVNYMHMFVTPFIDEFDDELPTTQETLEGHSDEHIIHQTTVFPLLHWGPCICHLYNVEVCLFRIYIHQNTADGGPNLVKSILSNVLIHTPELPHYKVVYHTGKKVNLIILKG